MIVGFTGTRRGMSVTQLVQFERLLHELGASEFHHGGCIGADTEASKIAHRLLIIVVCHPPSNKKAIGNYYADVILHPKAYLIRNHDIVDIADVLIATPKENYNVLRSGTWATIRYAEKLKMKCYKIF